MVRLSVLIAVLYAVFRIAPPYINDYRLQEEMRTEARFASVNRKSPEQVREDIYLRMRRLGVPAGRDSISVEEVAGGFHIAVDYVVPVSVFHYPITLRFHTAADSDSI